MKYQNAWNQVAFAELLFKNSYSIFLFFRITSVQLQSKNILLFPSMGQFLGTLRCVLEHECSMCNSKTLQHTKELDYFFILEPKQLPLQTSEGEGKHTVMCRIQRKSISLWHTVSLTAAIFYNTCNGEISKGNLDVKPCVCSKHKNAQRVKHQAKHCIFFSSLCLLGQIKLRREEMWPEEERESGTSLFLLKGSPSENLLSHSIKSAEVKQSPPCKFLFLSSLNCLYICLSVWAGEIGRHLFTLERKLEILWLESCPRLAALLPLSLCHNCTVSRRRSSLPPPLKN